MSESENSGSITKWIEELRDGDPVAMERIFDRYFRKIQVVADKILKRRSLLAKDSEDFASESVFALCQRLADGKFPKIENRDHLWVTLLRIVKNRIIDVRRAAGAQKREPDNGIVSITDLLASYEGDFDAVVSKEQNPSLAVEFEELMQHVLRSLPDENTRKIAALKLQGLSNAEIEKKLNTTSSTILRKTKIIQEYWKVIADNDSV